ncbi:phospholipid carrier-dependent glycosyltransferase [Leucothrix sargassi]|nr:phospholipid carrier-dependent glycosyltransferase [Leucothrix sargassi]
MLPKLFVPPGASRAPILLLIGLLLLLCGSAYLRLQFGFNAGHMDEYDYLFVGKQLLSGGSWSTHIYIFGSDLSWYLLGWADETFGGLQGARLLSGLLGLVSLGGIYAFVFTLWRNHLAALLAVVLLATQSIHVFLSRFATYDIISFTFFCLALTPLLLAAQKQSAVRYAYLLAAILLLSLSVMTKYVVVLYLPVIGLILLFRAPRMAILLGIGVGAVLLTYVGLHWESLQVLYKVQIQNVHGDSNGSLLYILRSLFAYLWPAATLCLLALIYSTFRDGLASLKQKQGAYLLLLMLLALPMVAYHFNALNMISLYKHMIYANVFMLIASAWLLAQLLGERLFAVKQCVVLGLLMGYAALNYQQLSLAENAYADVTLVIAEVEGKLDAETTILSEDPYLFRYLAFSDIPQQHIKESRWLDNNRDGVYENKDVVEAVWDAKFSYVYLNDQLHPNFNKKLRKVLVMRSYTPVFEQRYLTSEVMSRQKKGTMSLYQRTRQPSVPLTDDDLFERGKALKTFLKEASHD